MWRLGNVARGGVNAVALVLLALAVTTARAQDLEPPEAAVAYRAFDEVQAWVRQGKAPGGAESVPVQGASVVLRLDGRVVGQGTHAAEAPSAATLASAAGAALARLDPSISEADRRRLAISLELSGLFVPFPAADATELTLGVSPGLDGIALARGERYAASFPSTMLWRGVGPAISLVALVNELGDDARDALATPAQLRARGYRIYRFRTVHLAQPAGGAGAVFMHRGGRVVDRDAITARTLGDMADDLAGYLVDARWPGIEAYGMLGNLHPATGRYEPPFAGPAEQAVAALALLRYARLRPRASMAGEAEAAALEVLKALGEVREDERAPWGDAGSAAATVLALAELGREGMRSTEGLPTLLERCRETLRKAYDPGAGFAEGLPPPVWGAVAAALVADRAHLNSRALSVDQLERAVRAVYRDTGPAYLVGQMPWLGWAELELSKLRREPTPAGPLLREMRRLVWDHQLRSIDLAREDRDLAGGVVFTKASTPLPTWQVCRPLAFVATMLGRGEFTGGSASGGEAAGELVHLLESLRFVRQLMADDATGHMYPRPGRAAGGLRAAPWDQTITPDATAMGLLTVVESLRSIEALSEGGRG